MSEQTVRPQAAVRRTAQTRDALTITTLLGAALLLVLPWGLLWAAVVWMVGAGLLWSSPTWSDRNKAIGTLVWPGGLIGPVVALTSVGQVCTQVVQNDAGTAGQVVAETTCTGFALDPWVGLPLSLVVLGAPFAVAAFLLSRSREA